MSRPAAWFDPDEFGNVAEQAFPFKNEGQNPEFRRETYNTLNLAQQIGGACLSVRHPKMVETLPIGALSAGSLSVISTKEAKGMRF
jgi:hypothetical protein